MSKKLTNFAEISYEKNRSYPDCLINFKNFSHVFGVDWLQKFQKTIAHLDLVKCSSASYGKDVKDAEDKCGKFLKKQIELFKPKLIICNGRPVCNWFARTYNIEINNKTKADLKILEGHKFTVIFSGFIGRIDNFARQRLGMEVNQVLKPLK